MGNTENSAQQSSSTQQASTNQPAKSTSNALQSPYYSATWNIPGAAAAETKKKDPKNKK